ncbi:DnaJ domain-containing protein [Lophiotrema nucula]|uniref:DnaJ domain-containing protein n=1 Tax=Lophiotrema nucula TaxID=690887 RepID=A0A6A5YYM0_9PLEO|nr:DnaJ domain-containing protein [Lophiotrema nucula]
MDPRTHYEILGLVPSASTPVIKASYKALALVHHPDKTLHLSAEDRADHATAFRDVQEAYDILSDPKLKVKYDAELQRHGNKVDTERSTFHSYSASPRSSPPKPARRPSVHLTTPEEKRAIKAKIAQQMAQIQEDRERRDTEEAGPSP